MKSVAASTLFASGHVEISIPAVLATHTKAPLGLIVVPWLLFVLQERLF